MQDVKFLKKKVMKLQSLEMLLVLVLGVHFGTFENFGHFNVAFLTNYKVYYKGGSGSSSQV
jgi:hypothetical protein